MVRAAELPKRCSLDFCSELVIGLAPTRSGHFLSMNESAEGKSREEDLIETEEEAAAAEAARIGGRSGMEGMDEAERAAAEHGNGEAEGFEEAEKLHQENATHGDSTGDPLADAAAPEAEPSPGVYGEADEIESTETDTDTAA